MSDPIVGVIMGSQSDWKTMKGAAVILEELEISFEARIVSLSCFKRLQERH